MHRPFLLDLHGKSSWFSDGKVDEHGIDGPFSLMTNIMIQYDSPIYRWFMNVYDVWITKVNCLFRMVIFLYGKLPEVESLFTLQKSRTCQRFNKKVMCSQFQLTNQNLSRHSDTRLGRQELACVAGTNLQLRTDMFRGQIDGWLGVAPNEWGDVRMNYG